MVRFLHSRYAIALGAAMAIACAYACFMLNAASCPSAMHGIILSWSSPWPLPPLTGMCLALAANISLAALIAYLNKTFNVLRCMTMIQGMLFLCMQAAIPATLCYFLPGTLIALSFVMCCFLLFRCYGDSGGCQRSVFLSFAIVSACSAFCAGFLFLLPVLWLGCAQMRIMNLRTLLASIIGMLVPWIIILGFGIVDFADIVMPNLVNFTPLQGVTTLFGLIGIVALTVFVGFGAWAQNVLKILTYNAQTRAMLSVLSMPLLIGIAGIALNFANAYTFLPLLNLGAAMQLGHMFGVIYRQKQSYWAVLVLMLIYLGIFTWRII